MVDEYGAEVATLAGHDIYALVLFVPTKFPFIVIVDANRLEVRGIGYKDPLMEDTDRAGVDIQLEPVMNVPLTWLEPVSVLKLAESPKT